ncbi:calcium-dependent protein kinase SK5-like protein [Tanacetum coccineum]
MLKKGTAPKKSRRVGSLETVSSMNSKGDYGNTFKGRNWRLKELFKMINIDNSGTITFEELKEGMRRVGSELMESEIKDFDGCESRCEGLDDSTVPEIKRCNLSNVILQLSAVGLALTSWRNLIGN